MKNLSLIFSLLVFASCHVSKKGVGSGTGEPRLHSMVISFTSIGSGTDTEAESKLTSWISSFEKTEQIKLNYNVNFWGKEGERDYCFDLSGLKNEVKQHFESQVNELLKGNYRVLIKRNGTCKT